MRLTDKIKIEDLGKTFQFYVGKEIKDLRITDSMIGFRVGQFFFTKRLGALHGKDNKKNKNKRK